jgi:predicted Zn finger-like uncharacterized protein
MTEITQCPECNTRFKVTEAQLDAHDGLVRCGRCHEVFDARKQLHDKEPSPQLNLPIDTVLSPDDIDLAPIPDVPSLEQEPTTLAQQVQFVEELTDVIPSKSTGGISWFYLFIAFVLTLALLAQATYFFRVEIGTQLPGLKPQLEDYCTLLDCTVALPQKIDLIVIESSELESDPNQGNVVILHALVHNRAPHAQAYPSLELTLTDAQDQAIARRIFRAAEYLRLGEDEKLGVPASRDLDIKVRLDTTDLKPSGYRLFLFYPK